MAITMREVFGQTLVEIGESNSRLVVLDSDVSSSTQTILFKEKFPDRFYNFGIAEADMVAAAAGMSTFGLVPVVSTFAFLLTLRAGDQIHSLASYNNLNIKFAGGYSGLSDFADGASHQSIMDIAVMRAMPNMTVLVPSDIESTRAAVVSAIEICGPVYIRLSRHNVMSLHGNDFAYLIGRANILQDGCDVTICTCGAMLEVALNAAKLLSENSISTAVVEFGTIKPFDKETLIRYTEKTKYVVTIEEHNIIGGLGSAVCETLAENRPAPVLRIGLDDCFGESARSYDQLLAKKGLEAEQVARRIVEFLQNQKGVSV